MARHQKSKSYEKVLLKELRDSEVAAEYLSAAIESGSLPQFLLALRNVAKSHGGVGLVSKITRLNRQNLYKMFSDSGNPTLSNLMEILQVLGIKLSFSTLEKKAA